jgi:hypothetical protein
MVCQTTKPIQNVLPTTKQINVTNLTPSQQRELFINHLNQTGFTGFSKKVVGKQTYYIFTYKN